MAVSITAYRLDLVRHRRIDIRRHRCRANIHSQRGRVRLTVPADNLARAFHVIGHCRRALLGEGVMYLGAGL